MIWIVICSAIHLRCWYKTWINTIWPNGVEVSCIVLNAGQMHSLALIWIIFRFGLNPRGINSPVERSLCHLSLCLCPVSTERLLCYDLLFSRHYWMMWWWVWSCGAGTCGDRLTHAVSIKGVSDVHAADPSLCCSSPHWPCFHVAKRV